jgi:DNA modification methylase
MTQLLHGDCLDILKTMPDESVDAIVTDPPYGLSFMGKKWDYDVPSEDIWRECLRVLKPGGHLLAFAGTRTQHRMAVRIEDAGFEIRDMIAWLYGSGFPKSLDVSKAIDKAAGAERTEVVRSGVKSGVAPDGGVYAKGLNAGFQQRELLAPATDAARQWQGWGTALKPAMEPITVARKPLIGTVAENVQALGTGAINVDGGRISTNGEKIAPRGSMDAKTDIHEGWSRPWMASTQKSEDRLQRAIEKAETLGRWPANVIHDGSEEPVALLGDAARFYYCAKASKKDRDEGLSAFAEQPWVQWQTGNGASGKPSSMSEGRSTAYRNTHPTVKPTDLMRYLVRLVTPPGGVVLDPFMGSGSTGKAARLEGFSFIGIEREAQYVEIARARIEAVQ